VIALFNIVYAVNWVVCEMRRFGDDLADICAHA
jgi:hypothetical protein